MKKTTLLLFIFLISCSNTNDIYKLPDGGIIETALAQYSENETRTIVIMLIRTKESLKDKDFSEVLMDDMKKYASDHCGGIDKFVLKSSDFQKNKVHFDIEADASHYAFGHQLESEIVCK